MANVKTDRNGFIFHGNTVTPVAGLANWCKIFVPDYKFNKHGERSVEFLLDPEDADSLIKILDDVKTANKDAFKLAARGKKVKFQAPYKDQLDQNDEPTGKVSFKFKIKGTENREIPTVGLVDSKGVKISGLKQIGNGSLIKVCFEPHCWYTAALGGGISLQLKAVQLLDLVEFETDATTMFGQEEGGYSYDSSSSSFSDDDSFEEEDVNEDDYEDSDEEF